MNLPHMSARVPSPNPQAHLVLVKHRPMRVAPGSGPDS